MNLRSLVQPIVVAVEIALTYCGLLSVADSDCVGDTFGCQVGLSILLINIIIALITWKWQRTWTRAVSLLVLLILAMQYDVILTGFSVAISPH